MGSLSAADLQDAFCEFLEALVHQTLCLREIYSPELFEKQRLYSIVVRRARHPELAEYIHHAIDSLKESVRSCELRKVAVCVLLPGGEAVERHVLDVQLHLDLAQASWPAFEACVRGCLVKQQYSVAALPKLPPGSTFEIAVEGTSAGCVPPQLWVQERQAPPAGSTATASQQQQQQQQQQGTFTGSAPTEAAAVAPAPGGRLPGPFSILPVKSSSAPGFAAVQLYVETSAAV